MGINPIRYLRIIKNYIVNSQSDFQYLIYLKEGKMQVIVVNHAKLDDTEFTSETIEDWKYTGIKLVPPDWYEERGLESEGNESTGE